MQSFVLTYGFVCVGGIKPVRAYESGISEAPELAHKTSPQAKAKRTLQAARLTNAILERPSKLCRVPEDCYLLPQWWDAVQ